MTTLQMSDPEHRDYLFISLDAHKDWRAAPTAKVRRPKNGERFSWTHTYTAFSQDFARFALSQLGASSNARVFDPFMGSGTTLSTAINVGCKAAGVDISPFAALLTRARLCSSVDLQKVQFYLNVDTVLEANNASHRKFSIIHDADLSYAVSVMSKIKSTTRLHQDKFWSGIITQNSSAYDSELVTMLCLVMGAKNSARIIRGTNPVWSKKISEASDVSLSTSTLQEASLQIASIIVDDLLSVGKVYNGLFDIYNCDLSQFDRYEEYDYCITSPPYMNRLDYVMAHLPELSILSLILDFDIDQLRRSMIGTTRITTKGNITPPEEWGETAERALSSIYNHSSKASKTYYHSIAQAYFGRLADAFRRTTNALKKGASGVIVIQDSFYKDILIDVPEICREMLQVCGCQADIVRTLRVKTHMGRMSPKQSRHVPHKELSEALIYFRK